MRTTLLFVASLLLVALPAPLAAATETFNCHSWEIVVGDRQNGAGVSTEDGALHAAAVRYYVGSDGVPLIHEDNDFLFSIWISEEQNGRPGYQRHDETCDETNDGEFESECLLSCTF